MGLYRFSAPTLFVMGLLDIVAGMFALLLPLSALSAAVISFSPSSATYVSAALIMKGIYSIFFAMVKR